MLRKSFASVPMLAAGLLAVSSAHAEPNWRAAPTYTTVDLSAGFMPDPWKQSLQAGGNDRVSSGLGPGCTGYINGSAPDVDLNYTAGRTSLYFHVSASADTTLVIYDPHGNWHCSDDALGLDPLVAFDAPLDGNYNIWVGVHGESRLAPAELRISEIDPRHTGNSGQRPDWAAAPTYGTVELSAGFRPDPWRRSLQAGGSHDVGASVGGQCVGYINASAPDIDLNYDAGSLLSLHFRAASSADTTLAVLDPAGTWHCNDDGIGLDPVVTIHNPRSGNYNVWLGVRGSTRYEPAELLISEIDPR